MAQEQEYYPPTSQPHQHRVLIYEANSLIGHRLVEHFRNDHLIEVNPNVIAATLNPHLPHAGQLDLDITIQPQNQKALNSVIALSDIILFPLTSSNSQQLQHLLKFLKCLQPSQSIKVIVFSSIFGWKSRANNNHICREDYPSRKTIDSQCKQLQNMTLGLHTLNGKTTGYVLSCGVVYGMGEECLFGRFKQALEQKTPLRVYGKGNNYIPMIHVDDLAQLAFDISFSNDSKSQAGSSPSGLFLAVDHSNTTQKELITTIASTLGNGQIQQVPIQQAFLEDDFNVISADIIVDPKSLPKISSWRYRGGLVAAMGAVVGQFNTSRGLKPNKILIHGPPASGKSQLANILAKNYGLPLITIKSLLEQIKAEDSPFANEIKALLEELKAARVEEERKLHEEAKKKKKGKGVEQFDPEKVVPRLEDKDVVKIVKRRVNMADCLNKGYIIDGVLKSCSQLEAVFQDQNGQNVDSIMPNSVFSLDPSDEQIKERIKKLPAEQTEGTHWNEEQTTRRLGIYKQHNQGKKWVEFFEGKVDVKNVPFEYSEPKEFIEFVQRNGPLGFKARPAEEEPAKKDEEPAKEEAVEGEKQAQAEAKEESEQEDDEQQQGFDLDRLTENETKILNEKSRPIRQYLIDNVIPSITEGLLDICKETPPDPIQYLIRFLEAKRAKKRRGK